MDKIKCLSLKTLSFYIDKELPAGKAKMVEKHLNECPDCRKTAEELYTVNKKLEGSLNCNDLPLGFEQRFYDKVKENSEIKTQVFIPRIAWAGSAIAVALLFIITFYGYLDKKAAITPGSIINNIIPYKITNAVTCNKLNRQPDVQTAGAKKKAIDDLANDALNYL